MASARQKNSKDRHQEILEAAARVITDRGLAETRIQDIAERCGVSPGLILYYFESKDRLLVEALTYANDQFYLRLSRELRRMRLGAGAARPADRPVGAGVAPRVLTARRVGAVARDLGPCAPRPRRWRRSARRSTAGGVSRSPTSIRYGRTTGEFPTKARTPTSSACSSARMIDGLAIQVLLNDTAVSPQHMHACAGRSRRA